MNDSDCHKGHSFCIPFGVGFFKAEGYVLPWDNAKGQSVRGFRTQFSGVKDTGGSPIISHFSPLLSMNHHHLVQKIRLNIRILL